MNAPATINHAEVLSLTSDFDPQHTMDCLKTLIGNGTTELRILKERGAASGYFNDVRKLTDKMSPFCENKSFGGSFYFTVNEVNPDVMARGSNRIKDSAGATSDDDIIGRRLLFVDLDAVRPSGISSTAEQLQATQKVAEQIRDWMTAQGCPEPMILISGNGCHLYWRIDLPNDDESTELIKNILAVLAEKFSSDQVDVDQTVFNASRIARVPGTKAKKGDDTKERPHRQCRKVSGPQTLEPVPAHILRAIAAQEPQRHTTRPQTAQRQQYHDRGRLNIPLFLERRGISYRKVPDKYGDKFQIDCVFNSNHTSPDAFLRQMPGGQINHSCSHDSCQNNKWREFRAAVGDPNDDEWENPPPQNPSVFETPVGGSPLNPGKTAQPPTRTSQKM